MAASGAKRDLPDGVEDDLTGAVASEQENLLSREERLLLDQLYVWKI